jgi:quercetin dioxygenase-like cupin family protein
MSSHALRLDEDRLAGGTSLPLGALTRVLYVVEGALVVEADGRATGIGADAAWFGTTAARLRAETPARVLRYELRAGPATGRPATAAGTAGAAASHTLLEQPITLDPNGAYLLRCDRVDFGPGGEAMPHGHKGGGIRCLIAGELAVRVGDQPARVMRPGDVWFESGVEPVHAIASPHEPTSFIRVSILPRAIRGQSSIVYVDPAHAAVKPRKYTVFVDEPITLP